MNIKTMNIKTISFNTPDSDIFKKIVGVVKTGFFDGRSTTTYFEECRWFVERYECIMVFTPDIGYHTSGWWKKSRLRTLLSLVYLFSWRKE